MKSKTIVPWGMGIGLAVALIAALRPLSMIRKPFLELFVIRPMLVWVPVAVGVLCGLVVFWHNRHGLRSDAFRAAVAAFVIVAPLTGLVCYPLSVLLTNKAIADHAGYEQLNLSTLSGGVARITPKEVAERQLNQSLNTSTEAPTNTHAIIRDGNFMWTAVRDPQGTFRQFTKPTMGLMSVDGDSSRPTIRTSGAEYDKPFKYGPGMQVRDSLKWQLAKTCYTCQVEEYVALPSEHGPVIMAPFVQYKGGLLVKRPVFGGVFLVYPDGRIDRLSPQEAANNEIVAGSGRMFPESLARKIADAYKYRKGIINRLFTKEDLYEVHHTSDNLQPYMQDFRGVGPQWVTTLKPRGKTSTTGLVIFTDAVTGRTRVWRPPAGESLISNEKALDVVRGTRLGVVFAGDDAVDAEGKFRAIEPRQVIVGGKLRYMVSVIPNAANRVEMTAIVEPHTPGRVSHVFPSSPAGDKALIRFLSTGTAEARFSCQDDGCPTSFIDTDVDADVDSVRDSGPRQQPGEPLPQGDDAQATLRRLLEQNRREQQRASERLADLRAQERDLLRLLRTVEGAAGERADSARR